MDNKKNAILITAYNDFEQLMQFCDFYVKYFDVFIHVDRKIPLPDEFIDFAKKRNIVLLSKYKINWGGIQHLFAVLDLLSIACKKNYDRYHIISENTFLIKHPDELTKIFEKGKNYIGMVPVEGNTLLQDRFQYYWFQDLYNIRGKGSKVWHYVERLIYHIQKTFRVKRKLKYPYDYKGYLYCHPSHDFVMWVLQYVKEHPDYLKELRRCYIPEEFFFQNLIMISPFKETLVMDSMIYDVWDDAKRGFPAELNMGDWKELQASNKAFARKFGSSSQELAKKVMSYLKEE